MLNMYLTYCRLKVKILKPDATHLWQGILLTQFYIRIFHALHLMKSLVFLHARFLHLINLYVGFQALFVLFPSYK